MKKKTKVFTDDRYTSIRQYIINDTGMRFIKDYKVEWKVPWDEITGVVTIKQEAGKSYFHGFIIHTGNKTYSSGIDHTFGPEWNAKEVFKEIVRRIAGSRVEIEDNLAWAADIDLRGRLIPPSKAIAVDSLEDQWHESQHPYYYVKFDLSKSVMYIFIGALFIAFWIFMIVGTGHLPSDRSEYVLCFAIAIPAFGFLWFGIGVFRSVRNRIFVAIRFNHKGLRLRLPSGKVLKGGWSIVDDLSISTDAGLIIIKLRDQPLKGVGPLSLGVMNAVYTAYWTARFKKEKEDGLASEE